MVVNWTKKALSDFTAILEYIEQDNPERAKSFAAEIKAKINNLTDFPSMGRPGRVIGTRELIVHENYIVPYRMRGGVIVVVRVQHAAKRWPRHF